jgi:hypothetical protein
MKTKQEVKLMQYNLGKSFDSQKTIEDVINPKYAYQDEELPRNYQLNPNIDGSKAKLHR